jgi:SET domain-containing protein
VFWTVEGKRWEIRSTEELPAGTFVFEFIEEILTNTEMDTRNKSSRKKKRGPVADYSMILDVDDRMEEVVTHDSAFCLDACKFGNVARFLNHRCGDANLVHHNVHIERRSAQLYHVFPKPNASIFYIYVAYFNWLVFSFGFIFLSFGFLSILDSSDFSLTPYLAIFQVAFFTARAIKAKEELTWVLHATDLRDIKVLFSL